MKKNGIIFLSLFLAMGNLLAANSLDSLMQLIDSSPDDTNKVKLLIETASHTRDQDWKKCLTLYHKSLDLSDSLGYYPGQFQTLNQIADIYSDAGAFTRGMEYGLLLLELAEEKGSQKDIFSAINLLGIINYRMDNNRQALYYFSQLDSIATLTDDSSTIFRAKHNMGTVYSDMGEREVALIFYMENLKRVENTDKHKELGVTYNNIGNVFLYWENYEKALFYLEKALEQKLVSGSQNSIGNTLNNIAEAKMMLGDFKEAEVLMDSALAIFQRTGHQENLLRNYRLHGDLYRLSGRYKEATVWNEFAFTLGDSIESAEEFTKGIEIQSLYEFGKQQDRIRELRTETEIQEKFLKRQNVFIILLVIGLGLVVFFAITTSRSARDRKKANALLKKKNKEIIAQRKELEKLNNDKDGLIQVLAHDLKAPLNRSLGLANLIRISGDLSEEQEKFVSMLEGVNKSAGNLINDLLDLYNFETGDYKVEYSKVDLVPLIDGLVKGCQSSVVKKGLKMNWNPQEPSLAIDNNASLITRVLDNLISNAIKFSEKGTLISIFLKQSEKEVQIIVQDNGQGIPKEEHPLLFQKFSRISVKPTGGESSSGLGLAIVKSITEALKGKIAFESENGKGTTFTVSFPRNAKKAT